MLKYFFKKKIFDAAKEAGTPKFLLFFYPVTGFHILIMIFL